MARILVISFSDLSRDPRVDRQIGFLRTQHELVAAGQGPPAHPAIEYINLPNDLPRLRDDLVRRGRSAVDLIVRRPEPAYWRLPVIQSSLPRLAGCKPDLVIANDLHALPLACRIANGRPVVFDAHEFAPEEHGDRLLWRAIWRPYADGLLRRYLPAVEGMMTVSRGIADRYTDRYRIPVEVVTNAPPMASTEPTLVGEPIRMIHHGGAVPERQIERTIEAMDLLGDGYQLDLMLMRGWPDYYRRLEGLVAATPRVQLVQPVSQRAIVQTINAYDIGVYLLPPTNENLRLALPNKLFEFIQARLAIAIGPSVEMARIVRDHQCGVVAEDFTPQSFAAAIAQLTPEKIMGFKRASHAAASTLSAESNREIVLRLVDRVLGR